MQHFFFHYRLAVGGGDSGLEDPLIVAQREFDYAINSLTNVQNDLQNEISTAENLIETVSEEDVTDIMVLSDLQTALENAKNAPEPTIPEMKFTLEEIQEQQRSMISNSLFLVSRKVNRINGLSMKTWMYLMQQEVWDMRLRNQC